MQNPLFRCVLFCGLVLLNPYQVSAETPNEGNKAQSSQFFKNLKGQYQDIRSRFKSDQWITGTVIKRGMIDVHAKGQDWLHNGKGSISIIEAGGRYYVQTEADFEISLAPDLYIYVSSQPEIKDETDFYHTKQVELGPLIKSKGAHYYPLPTSIQPPHIHSVTVMCKRYRQYMASADVH